jgi:hypothetical protein
MPIYINLIFFTGAPTFLTRMFFFFVGGGGFWGFAGWGTFAGNPAGIGPVNSPILPGGMEAAISAEGVPGFGATAPFWMALARFMATAWFLLLGGIALSP